MTAQERQSTLTAIGTVAGLVALAVLVLYVVQWSTPTPPEPGPDARFDEWMAWHMPQCQQCTASAANPNVSLCMDAFTQLQARLKNEPKPTPAVPTPDTRPAVPPGEVKPAPALSHRWILGNSGRWEWEWDGERYTGRWRPKQGEDALSAAGATGPKVHRPSAGSVKRWRPFR